MSYFRSFIWSLVIKGSGSNSKIEADTFAKDKGKGIKNLFFPISSSNFSKISLKVKTSGIKSLRIFKTIQQVS